MCVAVLVALLRRWLDIRRMASEGYWDRDPLASP